MIWQIQHNFISLEFLSSIHARDVRAGRTEGFLVEQLIFATNPVTVPLWVAGLYVYFFAKVGVGTGAALGMSLVWFSLTVVVSGLGGLAFLLDTHAAKRTQD